MHWNICKHYSIKVPEKWYKHHPVEVTSGKDVIILWDFTVHTDRTIITNKPDIVIKDLKARTCQIIDMAIPCDSNISTIEYDKLQIYKDLEIEITRMWYLNATTIPVIIGALGIIRRELVRISRKFWEVESFKDCRRFPLLILHIYLEKNYL